MRAPLVALLWAVALSLGLASQADGGPNIPQGAKASLSEYLALCRGNEIKIELLNPTCRGWHLDSSLDPDTDIYQKENPTACGNGRDGVFQCYFRVNAYQGCKAYTSVQQQRYPTDGAATPYKPQTKKIDPEKYTCTFCWGDQTAVDGYCPNGDFEVDLLPIPPEAYFGHCDIPVSGPYSLYPDEYTPCGTTYHEGVAGLVYTKEQKDRIKDINKQHHKGALVSDLKGFCYKPPKNGLCIEAHPTMKGYCVEPEFLNPSPGHRNSAEVHHVMPRTEGRGCPCGKNSNANAAVISKALNLALLNRDRTSFICDGKTEIDWVNALHQWEPPTPAPRP